MYKVDKIRICIYPYIDDCLYVLYKYIEVEESALGLCTM